MYRRRLDDPDGITRIADGARIPTNDPANYDCVEYLQWVADGNTPEPYVAPPMVIPEAVTMRQARLALLGAGLLPAVDSAISTLPEPQHSAAVIEWEYSQEVQRHNGFVSLLAPVLGLTEGDLDQLFLAAGGL